MVEVSDFRSWRHLECICKLDMVAASVVQILTQKV